MSDREMKVEGIRMSDGEIDDFLYEQSHGILSLVSDGDAYGVPISFGYDGDRIFMNLLQFGDKSKKHEYVRDTEQVSLGTYTVETKFKWKSVIVSGELQDVAEEEIGYVEDVLDDNAWFPALYPPTSPMSDVDRVALHIEEATGRKGQDYQK